MPTALQICSCKPNRAEETLNLLSKSRHHSGQLRRNPPEKKFHRLIQTLKAAISETLKSSPNFPDIRRHFDSLPISYSRAGFNIDEIRLHLRLLDEAAATPLAFQIQKISGEGFAFKIVFASRSALFSWPILSGSIRGFVSCFKKIQIYEKNRVTVGVVTVLADSNSSRRIEAALRSADSPFFQIHLNRWVLRGSDMEIVERVGINSFIGVYKGKKVWIKKVNRRGCEVEIEEKLMHLMSCGHKKLLQFCGICFSEGDGVCVVTRLMAGGSVSDLMRRKKKVRVCDVVRIGLDVSEGLLFLNSHGVAYRDLSRERVLLDGEGNACLGDMGVVCRHVDPWMVGEYETGGYQWLAPEIIAGDPDTKTETWMSNVYSFGMLLWEMVTGEMAYSACTPVQAAVGIAACGMRPEIPKDCPSVLRSLMLRCWNNCPSKRPRFSEIVAILLKQKI